MFTLDLPARRLSIGAEQIATLNLSEAEVQAFAEGWDEIDVILNRELAEIHRFEAHHRTSQPWLFDLA